MYQQILMKLSEKKEEGPRNNWMNYMRSPIGHPVFFIFNQLGSNVRYWSAIYACILFENVRYIGQVSFSTNNKVYRFLFLGEVSNWCYFVTLEA